jgi:3-hydroxy-9,10-secoandrosta-1,3,5(10)-triene-9,17-dione monooxygenase reductase component
MQPGVDTSLPAAPAPDTRRLRSALGRFTTGVTIVTCTDAAGEPVGLTVNSFSSLSLEPPLVLWSLRRESPSAAAFSAARHFAVNVLAESQVGVSRSFAARRADRFAEGEWSAGLHGLPVLAGAAAVFECESVSAQVAGDHLLFIGRVLACGDSAVPPLLFQAGHYRTIGHPL